MKYITLLMTSHCLCLQRGHVAHWKRLYWTCLLAGRRAVSSFEKTSLWTLIPNPEAWEVAIRLIDVATVSTDAAAVFSLLENTRWLAAVDAWVTLESRPVFPFWKCGRLSLSCHMKFVDTVVIQLACVFCLISSFTSVSTWVDPGFWQS